MRNAGRTVACALAALLTLGASSPAQAAPVRNAVGVQQISSDLVPGPPNSEDDTQSEPDIAVDPNDPSIVVAVVQEGRFTDIGSVGIAFATSHDGGRTWTTGTLPNLTQASGGVWERAGDPVVAFGPDGAVYVTTIGFDRIADFANAVTIQRSDDGGLTWGDPVLVRRDTNPSVFNDKEWLTVDTNPASPHLGRVYVAWDRVSGSVQPPVLSWSDDRGATWSPRVNLSTRPALGTIPLVRPDGSVTVVYLDVQTFQLIAQTSTSGGTTWGPEVVLDTCQALDPPDQRDGGCIPGAAVDPVTGFEYAGWTDSRFRTDGLDDAVVTRSTDGGASWGPLVVVNPDGSGSQLEHMTTALAVFDHTVHVSYFVRKGGSGTFSPLVSVRESRSTDDGATFGGELTLGLPIDLRYSAITTGLHFLGDYMGIAVSHQPATSQVAHAVWCRSFRPQAPASFHQTTWSAAILAG